MTPYYELIWHSRWQINYSLIIRTLIVIYCDFSMFALNCRVWWKNVIKEWYMYCFWGCNYFFLLIHIYYIYTILWYEYKVLKNISPIDHIVSPIWLDYSGCYLAIPFYDLSITFLSKILTFHLCSFSGIIVLFNWYLNNIKSVLFFELNAKWHWGLSFYTKHFFSICLFDRKLWNSFTFLLQLTNIRIIFFFVDRLIVCVACMSDFSFITWILCVNLCHYFN